MFLSAHGEVVSSLELSASLDDSSNVVDARSVVNVTLSSVLTPAQLLIGLRLGKSLCYSGRYLPKR